ncbi:alpha/beta hydrolase [Halosquirtibacter laminarini]|uniref:Alpha/beta hydrolase n=1 Tax=Halosquirtibacter laminarini TaxID=3374600 RepID=A0AC61NMB9_9BACT|nr:alpha/beta hydrolase [Prolixibacteraceae bacterium]
MQQTTWIFLMTFFLSLHGVAQKQISLWKTEILPNYQESNEKEILRETDIKFIRNVQTPSIEVYIPSKKNANGKAVLIMPGGGYSGLAYDWEGTDIAKWLNSRGIAAFVLKYRLPQSASVIFSHKAPLQDAQRAIRWIRYHANDYHVNANQVGVIGFSAGGHLASTLGTHYDTTIYNKTDEIDNLSARPNFMMLIYPVISMQDDITHKGSRRNLLGSKPSNKLTDQFSNELHVTQDTPPTFIIHSADDKAVPIENSIRMYQALVKNDVKSTMHLYPTGGHGYGMGLDNSNAPNWTKQAEAWLNTLP